MDEDEINRHLVKALMELDVVKEEYRYRKNKQKEDTIDRIIKLMLNTNGHLLRLWLEEKKKWKQ